MQDDVKCDCTVRLKFAGISQYRLMQFLEHIAAVAAMYSAKEFVVETPDDREVPRG